MLSLLYRCSTPFHPFHALALPLAERCFSIAHCRLEASSVPSDSRLTKDAESRKKHNAARKARYANDPEHRATICAQSRDRHNRRYANDLEYRAKSNARSLAAKNARYRSDAQFRARLEAEAADRRAKQDPVAREEILQRKRVHNNQRYADDYTFRQRRSLQTWLRNHIPTRELTWRTHDAELHVDRVARLCSGEACGFEKKLKLWMKRKDSDPALYDCYNCFTSDWVPEKVLPIGYEHVIFGSGEKIEPRPVPLDAAGDEASKSANPSSGAGTVP
ncbi:hypothetical protein M436DRAFT_81413 [Aureobasidium namibiae CBS 147.97]|uniref:Uncharacterized protein n=1 Tax=Aureobasidium namibiae CBS 147.97 TaxID=1043004 RepID=A0A074WLK0_9PEZI